MRLFSGALWPRTLAAQLVVVTAAAVVVSNIGVAVWFEMNREQLTESAINERLLDRAVSASALLASIPAKQRPAAASALSSGPWEFHVHRGKAVVLPMSDPERALAQHAEAMLPKGKSPRLVTVKFRGPNPAEAQRPRKPGSIVEVTIPLVRGSQLVTTFFRPPAAPWPAQSIAAAAAAIVLTSLAAALVARRVTRPLSLLADAASQVARGGSAPRVPEQGPDDVRRAASAFNAMTDQVSRTLESQRQLLSAVGHDLRTPITALRINTEFVQDAETRERLEKNLEELQDLTESVLSAAKGVGWERSRKIDLAALIESLCADMEERHQPVTWQPHAPAPFTCRPDEIRRATRNLIENAIAYGKAAHVQFAELPDAYEIVVEDEGPGIADGDRVRVFEPFVRLEESRSLETGGTGLGLTIVKAIAEGHGGGVALENRSEGGLRARMRLPRDTAQA